MRRQHILVPALLAASPALGQTYFQGIGYLSQNVPGSLAYKISKDGNVVVGESIRTDIAFPNYRAFRWTRDTGIQNLGVLPGGENESVAYGLSFDGSVIVGQSDDGCCAEGGAPFRWTQASGMQPLGDFGFSHYGYAYQTPDDGTVIMGQMDDGGDGPFGGPEYEAFRWTAATGMQHFGHAPNNVILGGASINSDATVAWSSYGDYATYKWTQPTGWLQQPAEYNIITWISDDGQTLLVSRCFNGTNVCPRAFRWTVATGFVDLGIIPGGSERGDTYVRGISSDGTVAVGFANFYYNNYDTVIPFIWDTVHGMRNLKDVLAQDYGLSEVQLWSSFEPTGLSADGRVICGTGFGPDGYQQGWVASIRDLSNPCVADFNCDGDVATDADIEAFFACLAGNCPPAPCACTADANRDGDSATDQDIEYFFAALAGGPC